MQTTPGRYLEKGNIFSHVNTLKKIVPHNIIIHNDALNGESPELKIVNISSSRM
jgi:hypothetical protein